MAEDNVHRQIERIRQTAQKIKRINYSIIVLVTIVGGGIGLWWVIFGGFREPWWTLTLIGAVTTLLVSLYLMWSIPAWPNLYCPHCSKPISSVLFWVCGNCAHENEPSTRWATSQLYTEKCGHCGRIPTGLICPDCDESIVFDERVSAEERIIARALGWEPSSRGAQSEEPKAEERKPSAGERLRERMAKMRERLTDTGDLDATFEEEKKKLEAELAAGDITEDQYKKLENDLKDIVHQERLQERLRDNDEA